MHRFLQLHLLTSYPPSNLNRDDLGRPKTAVMGGAPRLRVSSQSLKRAWRTSELFRDALADHIGTRTKAMGQVLAQRMQDRKVNQADARAWARQIAAVFGKLKQESKDDGTREALEIEQLAHFSPEERAAVERLADTLAQRGTGPTEAELGLLRRDQRAVDIALFGRMLAASPAFNVEAAAQVAHAITVHQTTVEDDFFSAVDDLNTGEDDLGAGHLGETEFAAGLFYLYLCVDRALLLEHLGDNQTLWSKSLGALVEAAATVAPTGKQNSFASRARASYILCETGDQQPRSLSVAFLKPVTAGRDGMLANAISALRTTRERMDQAYGPCAASHREMDLYGGTGTLADILACARG